MKVVIPVAGRGSNLRPLTNTQPKALLPVAGKPIIAHIIDSFIEVGLQDFVIIIGYMGARIQEFILRNYTPEQARFEFVVQVQREGSAHALHAARAQLQGEQQAIICLGDSIVHLDWERFLSTSHSVLGVHKVARPSDFGIAELNADGTARRLVEKPRIPKSNIGLVGLYKICDVPALLRATDRLLAEPRQDYMLTEALQYMLEEGHTFEVLEVDGWYDCGKKESMLEANAILLSRPGFPRTQSTEGMHNTVLIQPVKVGQGCQISNAIIGPNVVIGDHTHIEGCIVRDTIIGSDSSLEHLILMSSLVGHAAHLKGTFQSLNLGDYTEIKFG